MTSAQPFLKAPICKPRQLAAFEGSTQQVLKAEQLHSAGKKDKNHFLRIFGKLAHRHDCFPCMHWAVTPARIR
jgi:hypothetical protein